MPELKTTARALGIKGFSRMRKSQLEAMIAAHHNSAMGQEFGTQANCERAPASTVREIAEELGVAEGTRVEMCQDLADIANEDAVRSTEIPNVTRCLSAPRQLIEDNVIRAGQSVVDDATGKVKSKKAMCSQLFRRHTVAGALAKDNARVKTCVRKYTVSQLVEMCVAKDIVWHHPNSEKPLPKIQLCTLLFSGGNDDDDVPPQTRSGCIKSMPLEQVVAKCRERGINTTHAKQIRKKELCQLLFEPDQERPEVLPAPIVSSAVQTTLTSPVEEQQRVSVGVQTAFTDPETHSGLSWRNIQNLALMHGILPVDSDNKLRTKDELIVQLNNIKSFDANQEPFQEIDMAVAMARFSYEEVQQRSLYRNLPIFKDGKMLTKREMVLQLYEVVGLMDPLDDEYVDYCRKNYLEWTWLDTLEAPQPFMSMEPLRSTEYEKCVLMPHHLAARNNVHVEALNIFMTDNPIIRPCQYNWLDPYMNRVAQLKNFPFGKLIHMPYFEDLPFSQIPAGNNTIKSYIPLCFKPKQSAPEVWEEFSDLIKDYENSVPSDPQTIEDLKATFNITDDDILAERERMPKFDMRKEYDEYIAVTGQWFYTLEKPVTTTDKEVTAKYIRRLMDIYKVRMEPEWKIVQRLSDLRGAAEFAPIPLAISPLCDTPCRDKPVCNQQTDVPLAEFFNWTDKDYNYHTDWMDDPIKNYKLIKLMQHLNYQNVTDSTDMKAYLKTFTIDDFCELLTRIDGDGVVFKQPRSVELFDGYLLALEGMLDFIDADRDRLRTADEFKDFVRLHPPTNVNMRASPRWSKIMEFIDESLHTILDDRMTRVDGFNDSQTYNLIDDIQEPSAARGEDRLAELFTEEEQEARQREFLGEYTDPPLTKWQT